MYNTICRIALPEPVTLRYSLGWPRVVAAPTPTGGHTPVTVSKLEINTIIDTTRRHITAQIARIPTPILLYPPQDFPEAVTDTPDQHAARVLQLLGSDPAAALQALIDGTYVSVLSEHPRIPSEIANWRAKAVLASLGMSDRVDAWIETLPDPERIVARLAWQGDAKIMRHSPMVSALATELSLNDGQVDALFVTAASLVI